MANNPINFNDPTGHRLCDDEYGCDSGGDGGGGRRNNNDDDDEDHPTQPEDDVASPTATPNLLDSIGDRYELGWTNFGQAWIIWTDPNAGYGQRYGAGLYMQVWGGMHIARAVGGTILLWEAIVPGSMSCVMNAACEGEVAGDWAQLSGQLRDAAGGKGNFGVGEATTEQANAMGDAWVGESSRVLENGIKISEDGLRQFRPPSYKPFLDMIQANLEYRLPGMTQWFSNAHINVKE